jgi:hypothetical protein
MLRMTGRLLTAAALSVALAGTCTAADHRAAAAGEQRPATRVAVEVVTPNGRPTGLERRWQTHTSATGRGFSVQQACRSIASLALVVSCLSAGCADDERRRSSACSPLSGEELALWRATRSAADEEQTVRRRRLAKHLVRCRSLDGRRPQEVRRLLGPPDAGATRKEWLYTVGPEGGAFSVDAEVLFVDFAKGRVVGTELAAT